MVLKTTIVSIPDLPVVIEFNTQSNTQIPSRKKKSKTEKEERGKKSYELTLQF